GWVKEFALMPYMAAMPQPKPEHVAPAIEQFLIALAKNGVSMVMDAGSFNSEETMFKAVKMLEDEGKLPVRYEATHHLYMPSQLKDAVNKVLEYRKLYGGKLLTFNTIKIHFDGVNEINTAAVLEDFANEKGNKGGMLYNEEELKNLILESSKHNINIHLHTVGDRSIRTALNAMEQAQKEYGKEMPVQLTLSHLEAVNTADMPRFKKLGVHANFTPHWLGGTVFKGSAEALGEHRFAHNQPVGAVWNAGANVTFSSDVVSMPEAYRANPFLGIQMGATRQDPKLGKDTPVFGQKSDRVSVKDMVKGYTINNAKQLAMQKEIGSIEVGKSADFVVIPSDIFTVDVYEISKMKPTAVYFQGKKQELK
ncbi:MAG: amidohydrolase family protein, partial [Tenacibaculum sp.]|nr:amidohydrolase family protein [Tenacibaculum sp.]